MSQKRNIMEWLSDHVDGSYNPQSPNSADSLQVINTWSKEYQPALKDPEQVARWLNHILEKWIDLEHRPIAFHGDAYSKLREIQVLPFETTMDYIFNDPAFTWIEGLTAFEVFKMITRRDRPAAPKVIGADEFYENVRNWLEKNDRPDVVHKRIKIFRATWVDGQNHHGTDIKEPSWSLKPTSCFAFNRTGKSTQKDNRTEYLYTSDTGVVQLRDRFVELDAESNDLMDGIKF